MWHLVVGKTQNERTSQLSRSSKRSVQTVDNRAYVEGMIASENQPALLSLTGEYAQLALDILWEVGFFNCLHRPC